MSNRITMFQFWMNRDSSHSGELSEEIRANADKLVNAVNALLDDLNWQGNVAVSSGWRPTSINSKTTGAAPKSAHTIGLAIDLLDDKDQSLAKLVLANHELLKKHGLWMEDMDCTRGKFTNWCHLDASTTRWDRPKRVFKP